MATAFGIIYLAGFALHLFVFMKDLQDSGEDSLIEILKAATWAVLWPLVTALRVLLAIL